MLLTGIPENALSALRFPRISDELGLLRPKRRVSCMQSGESEDDVGRLTFRPVERARRQSLRIKSRGENGERLTCVIVWSCTFKASNQRHAPPSATRPPATNHVAGETLTAISFPATYQSVTIE